MTIGATEGHDHDNEGDVGVLRKSEVRIVCGAHSLRRVLRQGEAGQHRDRQLRVRRRVDRRRRGRQLLAQGGVPSAPFARVFPVKVKGEFGGKKVFEFVSNYSG